MSTITVSRKDLQDAVTFASLGLSKRPVARIMNGMLVTVTAAGLELAAFDFETAARATVAGHADGTATVLVTGSELATTVKSLPRGKNVTAELGVYDDGLIVLCDGIEAVLPSLPIEEYPQLPPMPELSGYVDAAAFARSVQRVALAAGRDDTMPALLGIKITSDGGTLELAATDRYRLALDRLHWTGPDGADTLLPASALGRFAAKADKAGKVSLHFGEERAALSDGTRTLITRVIPGEYVRYRDRAPHADNMSTTVLVVAAALKTAVDRAAKLLERNIPVRLDVTEDGITVRAHRDGEVVSSQVVPAALDGDPIEAGFCPAYLADALAGVDGEALISFASPVKPIVVTSADGTDPFTAICMPIRLHGEA